MRRGISDLAFIKIMAVDSVLRAAQYLNAPCEGDKKGYQVPNQILPHGTVLLMLFMIDTLCIIAAVQLCLLFSKLFRTFKSTTIVLIKFVKESKIVDVFRLLGKCSHKIASQVQGYTIIARILLDIAK